ncbi:hypothetical protein EWM64_g6531 [Hericium alpestre]|uniref:Uncharacterized protein n=1 Tax=Hericium alpestre TaxID=135208 RepID=A0A4Y9ZUG7_9AGAM|nr:hypothetical protein EWM64_g6531 [Hericium alpestre]
MLSDLSEHCDILQDVIEDIEAKGARAVSMPTGISQKDQAKVMDDTAIERLG